jgi:hypothetical protein
MITRILALSLLLSFSLYAKTKKPAPNILPKVVKREKLEKAPNGSPSKINPLGEIKRKPKKIKNKSK